jgi:acyl carrier protein
MTEEELRDVVIRALTEVAPEIDPASIDPRAVLTEELDIDSMDFLNVVVAVHEQTGIEIPERDYPKLSTLDGAVAYLSSAQAGDDVAHGVQ